MNDDLQKQIDDIKRQLDDLQRSDANPHIELDTDLFGLFETVSIAPSNIPKILFDQVKVYTNGATLRLYWYDAVNHTWHYVTATA